MGLGTWGGWCHLSCPLPTGDTSLLGASSCPFLPVFGTAGGKEVGRSELGATREEQSSPSQAATPGEHWLNGKVKTVLKWGR